VLENASVDRAMLKGISRKLLLNHLLTSVFVFGLVGVYFYIGAHRSIMRNLQARLLDDATMIGESIDVTKLDSILNEGNMENDAYRDMRSSLSSLTNASQDIAYAYIVCLDKGQVRFVVDSESRPNQANPGEIYTEQTATLLEGFKNPSVTRTVSTNRWGSFLSGYAPIKADGHEYVIGMDMTAEDVASNFHELKSSATLSLLFALVLTGIFSYLLSGGFTRRIRTLIHQCGALERGEQVDEIPSRGGDEFSILTRAFSRMKESLKKSKDDQTIVREELKHANEELEQRVVARTRELLELNRDLHAEIEERKCIEKKRAEDFRRLKSKLEKNKTLTGLLPICASCKQIRDEDGGWIQLESYIEAHSDIVFSHGICPDCIEKLYPVKQPIKRPMSGVPFLN
jgi:rubrerythrin